MFRRVVICFALFFILLPLLSLSCLTVTLDRRNIQGALRHSDEFVNRRLDLSRWLNPGESPVPIFRCLVAPFRLSIYFFAALLAIEGPEEDYLFICRDLFLLLLLFDSRNVALHYQLRWVAPHSSLHSTAEGSASRFLSLAFRFFALRWVLFLFCLSIHLFSCVDVLLETQSISSFR